ncbi:AAA family ATPase [Novosphingobium pokkalii]|uniref:AAA family ATPase n=1 Tax=Novosphingobium pokkalii TaxID=1770194 RepID=UPI00362EB025
MYRLERIVIQGFRGQSRPIELDLQPDANFLIGRNGTGKTTLINMIHAGLAMDLPALRESNFGRIEYTFKKDRLRAKPKLTIIKEATEEGIQRSHSGSLKIRPTPPKNTFSCGPERANRS